MAWSKEMLAAFAPSKGSWKCDACLVSNPPEQKSSCMSCETPRAGFEASTGAAVLKRKPLVNADQNVEKRPKFTFGVAPIIETNDITKTDRCGQIRTFGTTDCGQLGLETDEDTTDVPLPTLLPSLKDISFSTVACGAMHVLALEKQSSTIYSFGCNDDGVLGRDENESEIPTKIPSFTQSELVHVSTGDCHAAAVTKNGECYTWGTYRDGNGYIGYNPTILKQQSPKQLIFSKSKAKILKIASGDNHTLAFDANGQVFSWGCGEQGQLSRRVNPRRKTAQLMPDRVILANIRAKIKASGVFCGGFHSFITTTCGSVYTFGLNNFGQLGVGDQMDRMTPTRIEMFQRAEIVQLDGGIHHSIALSKSGQVYTFGRADSGQTGLPNLSKEQRFIPDPTLLYGLPTIVQVSSGGNHSFALSKGGCVYSWGFGESNQLGTGSDMDQPTPTVLDLSYPVYSIDGGAQFSALISS